MGKSRDLIIVMGGGIKLGGLFIGSLCFPIALEGFEHVALIVVINGVGGRKVDSKAKYVPNKVKLHKPQS